MMIKDQAQIFIDQRGNHLCALVAEEGNVLAKSLVKAPLDKENLQSLIAELTEKSGHKLEEAHLLIASHQVQQNIFQLQDMPIEDAELIIKRSLSGATGEEHPVFRLTGLAPHQDKNVFLAEQIPQSSVAELTNLFRGAGLKLVSISSGLQAALTAFAPHRDEILQAHAIFDINAEEITATFVSPIDVLGVQTQIINEPTTDSEEDDTSDNERALKRQLFSVLNIIHGLHSQHLRSNPLFPVEKVWLCGSGANIAGLEESLVDAMDVEVSFLDLLADQTPESMTFTPLAGLIRAHGQVDYVNFIPVEISSPRRLDSRTKSYVASGATIALLVILCAVFQFNLWSLEKALKKESYDLQYLQAAENTGRSRIQNLNFLKQLNESAPHLYSIFGEIADNLPREVLLDSLSYSRSDGAGSLKINSVIEHITPWKNKRIFTSLMSSLDESPHLQCTQEPDMSFMHVNEQKLISIQVICQTAVAKGGK